MKKRILIIFAFLVVFILSSGQLLAQGYRVIIHSSNTTTSMTKMQVANLFLKKTSKFDDGTTAFPVDQVPDNTVRIDFSTAVHGKNISAVKAYWQKMIFSGRSVPPPEKASDREVISYVQSKPGAIGYVSASASTRGVKVVNITE